MILRADEIRRSLTGAWLLLKGKPEGMRAFDTSIEGFWRSFGVILLLCVPFVIIVMAEQRIIIEDPMIIVDEATQTSFALAKAIGFVLDWVCLPILVALLAKPLGISQRFVPYIVARNWASVIAILPYTVPALLFVLGLISSTVTVFLTLVAVGFVLRYSYMVARIALQAPMSLAIGFVVLDTVLSFVIGAAVNRAIGI